MATELEYIKTAIESGDSCIETYENVDLEAMKKEGDGRVADMIETVLRLVQEINDAAGVE